MNGPFSIAMSNCPEGKINGNWGLPSRGEPLWKSMASHVFPVNLPQSIGKPKSVIRRENDSVQWINILNQTPSFEMIDGGISRRVRLQNTSKGLLVNQGENENHVCEVNSFSPVLLHFNKYVSSMRPLLCGECGASTPNFITSKCCCLPPQKQPTWFS